MEFLTNNWYILMALIAVAVCAGFTVYRFGNLPTEEQLQKVREWLLFAVTEAETQLGSGTGQLKLRNVYDLFVQRFPWLVKTISFAVFSGLVDDALDEMRKMLAKNNNVKAIVEGKANENC